MSDDVPCARACNYADYVLLQPMIMQQTRGLLLSGSGKMTILGQSSPFRHRNIHTIVAPYRPSASGPDVATVLSASARLTTRMQCNPGRCTSYQGRLASAGEHIELIPTMLCTGSCNWETMHMHPRASMHGTGSSLDKYTVTNRKRSVW
jgi:hypothetical protein